MKIKNTNPLLGINKLKITLGRVLHSLQTKNAFTLVELIVVISILAILGTISFASFFGFQKSARDSKRITNVAIIAKGFDLNIITGRPIVTSETATGANITISSSGIIMTGYYGDTNIRLLSSLHVFGNDLTTNDGFQSYKYGYYPSNNKYQVLALLEDKGNLAENMNLLDSAYADTTSTGYVYIKGNFTSTGGVNSLIPDPILWDTTTPDVNNTKIIAGTGTLQSGDSTVQSIPIPPVGTGCNIGDASLIGDNSCNIL